MAQAADSASLAGAIHYSYTDDVTASKKQAQKYYLANVQLASAILPLEQITVDSVTRQVMVNPDNKMKVYFQDRANMGITVRSAAIGEKVEQKKMEVSLVLDVTTSMAKNNKMAGMKDSAKNLISTLYENPGNEQYIHVSLVPFNTTVRFNDHIEYRNWLNAAHLQRLENNGTHAWSGCVIHNLPPQDANDATHTEAKVIPYNRNLGETDETQNNTPLSLASHHSHSSLLHLVQERVSASPGSSSGGGGSSNPPSSNSSGGGSSNPPSSNNGGGGSSNPPSGSSGGTSSYLPPSGWSGSNYTIPSSDPWASGGSWGSTPNTTGIILEPPQYGSAALQKPVQQCYSPDSSNYFPPSAPSTQTWATPSWTPPSNVTSSSNSSTTPVNPVTLTNLPNTAGCELPSIVPLSNDKEGLLTFIDSFSQNGYGNAQLGLSGTIPSIGMLWGWRTLSFRWNGLWPDGAAFTPGDSDKTLKSIIFLTDGLGEMPGILGTTIGYGAFAYPNGAPGKHAGYTWSQYNINAQTYEEADLALDEKLRSVCAGIKRAGDINVYTIGFDVLGQPGGSTRAKGLLEYCASDAAKFYLAANNDELKKAFKEIANSLLNDPKVRIVQ
jgi:hypothetical protein